MKMKTGANLPAVSDDDGDAFSDVGLTAEASLEVDFGPLVTRARVVRLAGCAWAT